MTWLNTYGHVVGALLALGVLTGFTGWVHRMVNAGIENSGKVRASKITGIPISELENPVNQDILNNYIMKRSNAKLIANRVADLCGTLLSVFLLLSAVLQALIIIAGIYLSIRHSENAAIAWLAVLMALATWIISLLVTFLCRMFTGRSPGQARVMRRTLALQAELNARHMQHTQNH